MKNEANAPHCMNWRTSAIGTAFPLYDEVLFLVRGIELVRNRNDLLEAVLFCSFLLLPKALMVNLCSESFPWKLSSRRKILNVINVKFQKLV